MQFKDFLEKYAKLLLESKLKLDWVMGTSHRYKVEVINPYDISYMSDGGTKRTIQIENIRAFEIKKILSRKTLRRKVIGHPLIELRVITTE